MAAYYKTESVEFYAELLYKAKQLGGPKEFDAATVEKLYEIRRKFGLPGKHPANLCMNKDGKNCHNCGGSHCVTGSVGSQPKTVAPEVVAEITKQVMAQLGMN